MVALVILDGWGIAPPGPGNAVAAAATPTMDRIWAECPHTTLSASGGDVGLPDGQMGNSEVGHLNLGAGRVVMQSLTRINQAIADGSLFDNHALRAACAVGRWSRLHLMGLVSEGGVHSSLQHLLALLDLARREGVRDVCVHAITDGRDTAPGTARGFLQTVEDAMRRIGVGRFASVMGRYYAMDRDRRWERTDRAYRTLMGAGPHAASWHEVLDGAATRRAPNGKDPESDEFIQPTAVGADGAVRAGDAVICFNWRADRVRQISRALTDPCFAEFERPWPCVQFFVGMCPYEADWPLRAAFLGMDVAQPVGEVVSLANLRQLRIAETEKYAHVTYFFNGGSEQAYPGEERILVPSPKVATYDLQPEMSAAEVAARGGAAIREQDVALVVLNFANPDMVGHTGDLDAARRACEAADRGLAEILGAVAARQGTAIVLADHGNAEVMIDPATGRAHTAHTTNPVPCVLVGRPGDRLRSGGRLGDVGPTLLALLGLAQPAAMTGRSLILREETADAGDR